MMVKCSRDNCGKLFETPKVGFRAFVALLRQQGWMYRGSTNGHVYFCDEHHPVEAEVTSPLPEGIPVVRRRRREKET
jgi:hypothetical protein